MFQVLTYQWGVVFQDRISSTWKYCSMAMVADRKLISYLCSDNAANGKKSSFSLLKNWPGNVKMKCATNAPMKSIAIPIVGTNRPIARLHKNHKTEMIVCRFFIKLSTSAAVNWRILTHKSIIANLKYKKTMKLQVQTSNVCIAVILKNKIVPSYYFASLWLLLAHCCTLQSQYYFVEIKDENHKIVWD